MIFLNDSHIFVLGLRKLFWCVFPYFLSLLKLSYLANAANNPKKKGIQRKLTVYNPNEEESAKLALQSAELDAQNSNIPARPKPGMARQATEVMKVDLDDEPSQEAPPAPKEKTDLWLATVGNLESTGNGTGPRFEKPSIFANSEKGGKAHNEDSFLSFISRNGVVVVAAIYDGHVLI